jgi:hypothetical protein
MFDNIIDNLFLFVLFILKFPFLTIHTLLSFQMKFLIKYLWMFCILLLSFYIYIYYFFNNYMNKN